MGLIRAEKVAGAGAGPAGVFPFRFRRQAETAAGRMALQRRQEALLDVQVADVVGHEVRIGRCVARERPPLGSRGRRPGQVEGAGQGHRVGGCGGGSGIVLAFFRIVAPHDEGAGRDEDERQGDGSGQVHGEAGRQVVHADPGAGRHHDLLPWPSGLEPMAVLQHGVRRNGVGPRRQPGEDATRPQGPPKAAGTRDGHLARDVFQAFDLDGQAGRDPDLHLPAELDAIGIGDRESVGGGACRLDLDRPGPGQRARCRFDASGAMLEMGLEVHGLPQLDLLPVSLERMDDRGRGRASPG